MQVENSLLAPVVLFANLHNTKTTGLLTQSKKIVAIPVPVDRRHSLTASLTDTCGPPSYASIVRGNNFNRPVYGGDLRAGIVREAYQYLAQRPNNPHFRRSEETLENFILNAEDQDIEGGGEGVVENDGDDQEVAPEQDAVERNRNSIDMVKSVFLPDSTYAPGSDGHPTNFLQMRNPYCKTMPIFFPNASGDVDDPNRNPKVSESEWLVHMLQCVRKNLSEFPLFVFTGAYRLDTARLKAAYNAPVGFTRFKDGQLMMSVAADRFQSHAPKGSGDYYSKLKMDLDARCEAFGYPQLFYTFSNIDRWDVTLSTALSQDGYDVWHKADESKLTLLDEDDEPGAIQDDYTVHISEADTLFRNWMCPYHEDCQRVPMSRLLSRIECKKLLARNSYNVQRIFDHRVRSLMNKILCSKNSMLGVKVYHSIKEFGDVSGWAHTHGVGWRRPGPADSVFKKLQWDDPVLTESDKDKLATLANSILTARLSAPHLSHAFPEVSGSRADDIVALAAKHQTHVCTKKCQIDIDDNYDGCWDHFPRLPSEFTIIASPQEEILEYQSKKVKEAVRSVLTELRESGQLHNLSLVEFLIHALGDIDAQGLTPHGDYRWNGGLFAQSPTLTKWLGVVSQIRDSHVTLFAVYYTALSTATWKKNKTVITNEGSKVEKTLVHQLVLRRSVSEVYVLDYNPFCIEAMRSNMSLSLVLYTPEKVIEYITKAQNRPNSQHQVVKNLREKGEAATVDQIVRRMAELREVSLAEAFFRIDDSLNLSEANVKVEFVNTNFPENRYRNFVNVAAGGIQLPGKEGRFIEAPGFFDHYRDK